MIEPALVVRRANAYRLPRSAVTSAPSCATATPTAAQQVIDPAKRARWQPRAILYTPDIVYNITLLTRVSVGYHLRINAQRPYGPAPRSTVACPGTPSNF